MWFMSIYQIEQSFARYMDYQYNEQGINKIFRKHVLLLKDSNQDKYVFLDKILNNCDIDESTGQLYCNKCKNLINIDWSRKPAFCPLHIISISGVILKEEAYEVYV